MGPDPKKWVPPRKNGSRPDKWDPEFESVLPYRQFLGESWNHFLASIKPTIFQVGYIGLLESNQA